MKHSPAPAENAAAPQKICAPQAISILPGEKDGAHLSGK
jgi:hypothetical protein